MQPSDVGGAIPFLGKAVEIVLDEGSSMSRAFGMSVGDVETIPPRRRLLPVSRGSYVDDVIFRDVQRIDAGAVDSRSLIGRGAAFGMLRLMARGMWLITGRRRRVGLRVGCIG